MSWHKPLGSTLAARERRVYNALREGGRRAERVRRAGRAIDRHTARVQQQRLDQGLPAPTSDLWS